MSATSAGVNKRPGAKLRLILTVPACSSTARVGTGKASAIRSATQADDRLLSADAIRIRVDRFGSFAVED